MLLSGGEFEFVARLPERWPEFVEESTFRDSRLAIVDDPIALNPDICKTILRLKLVRARNLGHRVCHRQHYVVDGDKHPPL